MDGWPMPPIPEKKYGVVDLKRYGKVCRNEALFFAHLQILHNPQLKTATKEQIAHWLLEHREKEE